MNFIPKDQIILLAGLERDARRVQIWSLPELAARLAHLSAAGLVDAAGLCEPAGVDAARRIHHITLDELLAEHLPAECSGQSVDDITPPPPQRERDTRRRA